MNLYEIAHEYRMDVARLQDLDLPPATVLDTVDAMQGELADKIRAVIFVAQELEALANARTECAQKMTVSANAIANRAHSLRAYAQAAIQNSGIMLPLRFPEFTVNLQRSPPACGNLKMEELPGQYKVTDVSFRVQGEHAEEFLAAVRELVARAPEVCPQTQVENLEVQTRADKRAILDELKIRMERARIDSRACGKALQPEPLPGAALAPEHFRLTVR